jgi:prepilin-type N-terminal cleavage/methylation domain-containing protein/prepilin-type processing-associated H-X9-DG protein
MNSTIHATKKPLKGFTLVEILVTIVIIAALAVLSVMGLQSIRQKSWAATGSANLRQNAVAIHGYLADKGHYPEAWDFGGGNGGGSWSWQIRDYLGFTNEETWPADPILHPRHGRQGIESLTGAARRNIHHFAASAIILQDVDESNPNQSKTYIRSSNVNNPSSVIMLGDAPLKIPLEASSGCHSAWWSLRFAAIKGTPEEPVEESALLRSVDFWINGKAHFLFADGHIESLSRKEVKRKHFQL